MKKLWICLIALILISCQSNTLIGEWIAEDDAGLNMFITIEFTEDTFTMMGQDMLYSDQGDYFTITMNGQTLDTYYLLRDDELLLILDGEEQVFTRKKD